MKINRFVGRTVAWVVWSVYSGIGLLACFRMLTVQCDPYGFLILIVPVFVSLLLLLFLYTHPKVVLDQQGICVKWWFRTRFYPWSDVCQVGISSFFRTWYYSNCLVLVRTCCSKRGYRDHMFHLRNLGKLIYIPAKLDVISFVRSCFGPLDFDLTDGEIEGSTVIQNDVDINSDW